MDYKVILSDLAKRQLDDILFYIYATLDNEVAAARVLEDAENTVQKLAQVGGSLKICEEPELCLLFTPRYGSAHQRPYSCSSTSPAGKVKVKTVPAGWLSDTPICPP